jgi:DNA invertase Pin-like site-specific DNA recombinase
MANAMGAKRLQNQDAASPRQHSSPATWVPTSGCAKVYGEKQSGAKTDRAELVKLLRRLEPGEMVTRLDRLARSTRDLLNILHVLGERSIGFKSLADSWADTTTPWQTAGDDAGWHCRVRAGTDPRSH